MISNLNFLHMGFCAILFKPSIMVISLEVRCGRIFVSLTSKDEVQTLKMKDHGSPEDRAQIFRDKAVTVDEKFNDPSHSLNIT